MKSTRGKKQKLHGRKQVTNYLLLPPQVAKAQNKVKDSAQWLGLTYQSQPAAQKKNLIFLPGLPAEEKICKAQQHLLNFVKSTFIYKNKASFLSTSPAQTCPVLHANCSHFSYQCPYIPRSIPLVLPPPFAPTNKLDQWP